MEHSLEIEAMTSSPSNSAESVICRMQAGLGSGRNDDGLELFSTFGFPEELIPESVRSTLAGRRPGRGSGWA